MIAVAILQVFILAGVGCCFFHIGANKQSLEILKKMKEIAKGIDEEFEEAKEMPEGTIEKAAALSYISGRLNMLSQITKAL